MSTKTMFRVLSVTAAATVVGAGVVAPAQAVEGQWGDDAPAAQAVSVDAGSSTSARSRIGNGVCDKGEFCLFHNSSYFSAIRDFGPRDRHYGWGKKCKKFIGTPGHRKGAGHCVTNDSAAVWNRTGHTIRIYDGSHFNGKSAKVRPDTYRHLAEKHMKNKVSSHK